MNSSFKMHPKTCSKIFSWRRFQLQIPNQNSCAKVNSEFLFDHTSWLFFQYRDKRGYYQIMDPHRGQTCNTNHRHLSKDKRNHTFINRSSMTASKLHIKTCLFISQFRCRQDAIESNLKHARPDFH